MKNPLYRAWLIKEKKMMPVNALTWEDSELAWVTIGTSLIRADKVDTMLFTGHFDKDKKPIYEGDIIKGFNGTVTGIVRWSEEDTALILDGGEEKRMEFLTPDYVKNFEIIGTIYDKELV